MPALILHPNPGLGRLKAWRMRLSLAAIRLHGHSCEGELMAVDRITAAELKRLMDEHRPVSILDTRAAEAWNNSDVQIPWAIRVPPDDVDKHLSEIPRDRLAVAYCT